MVVRVRIADTEAIAKYEIKEKEIEIIKIVTLNYKKGRRTVKLHKEGREKLSKIIASEYNHA